MVYSVHQAATAHDNIPMTPLNSGHSASAPRSHGCESVSERSERTRGCLFAKKNIAMQYAFVSCNLVHREKSTEHRERQWKGSRTMKVSRTELKC